MLVKYMWSWRIATGEWRDGNAKWYAMWERIQVNDMRALS